MEPTMHPRARSMPTALPSYAESNACARTLTTARFSAPNARPRQIKWRFAIQTFNDQYLFDQLDLSGMMTPSQVIERFILAYHLRVSLLIRLINRYILCRRLVVYSATLAPATFMDLEALKLPHYVLLKDFIRNEYLTLAFHDPFLLRNARDTTSFLEEYISFEPGCHMPRKLPQVCVIGFEFDSVAFLSCSVLSFVFSVALGGIVGYATSNLEAGCALGGGLASLAAALQVIMLKVAR
ncbi:hypothetical protein K491DRAFT_111826 [Lophiostoma macrostomum CBS 122681]|uniref:Uncharacterized protein n=1 Tax=Lophiostoma macrostomum CBS 122681 TaxID=1314788 RepID=A0A6A6SVB0_9PLEO|nr:hypothetical protein K491DRAFT_111826 [Lophiostoma macrostomum CBS 122681]